ncbi:MAG: DUF99 family protein, partial [Gemmatimonadales bacterium]
MNRPSRPHILGVDDAPFDKRQPDPVPIVGVAMEGPDVIESVALGQFPVDGEGATEYLATWIAGLRARPMLQAVILGGITIAGLGIVDLMALAERLGLPALVVTRHNPAGSDLADALRAAGLHHRLALVERTPRAYGIAEGLYLAHAGAPRVEAEPLVMATLAKARLPEPLRVAHLIGQALVLRESRAGITTSTTRRLLLLDQPLEARVSPERREGRIDPDPAGRDEERNPEQSLQLVEGTGPLTSHGVDPYQLQLVVGPAVRVLNRTAHGHTALRRGNRLLVPPQIGQGESEEPIELIVSRVFGDGPLPT